MFLIWPIAAVRDPTISYSTRFEIWLCMPAMRCAVQVLIILRLLYPLSGSVVNRLVLVKCMHISMKTASSVK